VKVIFTVLIGGYDELVQAPSFNGWEPVLFTDVMPKDSKGWNVRLINPELSPEKESRRYKFLSHVYLKEYDLVCYIDANMTLLREPPSSPIWNKHYSRVRIIDEAKAILQYNKANADEITSQIRAYVQLKFKDNMGLFQNGFFVRNHSDSMNNRLMELTFDLVLKYSHRDQLALPFACEILGYLPQGLQRRNMINSYVKLNQHKKKTVTDKVYVHHITPARSDKNFGKAINQMIEGLPDNDWICLRDIDTLPAWHEEFIKQCEEVANNPQGFGLIGCMTNRIGLDYQLVPGMFEEFDIRKHRAKAKELAKNRNIKSIGTAQTVGGLFMMFSKKIWLEVGKFPEGGVMIKGSFIDYLFSVKVRAKGYKLGIAEGIYLFHSYRLDAKNGETRKDIQRLI